jgi:hypothetical protein
MPRHWTDQFSFIKGVVRYRDLAYLALTSDEVAKKKLSQSIVAVWDAGEWKSADGADQDWEVVHASIALKPLEQALFLGEAGQIVCIGSGDVHEEFVGDKVSSPTKRGPMRGIRCVANQVYAVGMNRQVYVRNAAGKWASMDSGARLTSENDDEVVGFEAIDGFNDKELYAVGWNGEIWRFDGKRWSQIDSPVNTVLVDVCCGGDGNVYACGRNGVLVHGRKNAWSVIEHGLGDDFWSLAWFGEELYVSTMDSVYKLKGSKLKSVSFGKDQPETCFQLSEADGVLWSIGAKDVFSFDGKKWVRID